MGYRHYETAGVAPLLRVRARPVLRGHRLRGGHGDAGAGEGPAAQRRGAARHRGGAGVRAGARAPRAAARPGAGGFREGPGGGRPAGDGRGGARRCGHRYWDEDTHGWRSDRGRYEVLVGSSSRDIKAVRPSSSCDVATTRRRPWTLTWDRLLVEPRRPRVIREQPHAPWFAVAAVCVGAFMGQLDASIVTVALPTLQHTFDASVGAVTWVGLSYLLVLVATVTAVGRFADMWGRKLLYVYGFVVFTFASVLCGLAPSLGALCGFRALQAVGAAMLQANSLAIIVLVMPGAIAGAGDRDPGCGPGPGARAGAIGRRAAPGRRRVAPHLLRQRALRPVRRHWPRSCWCRGAGT